MIFSGYRQYPYPNVILGITDKLINHQDNNYLIGHRILHFGDFVGGPIEQTIIINDVIVIGENHSAGVQVRIPKGTKQDRAIQVPLSI